MDARAPASTLHSAYRADWKPQEEFFLAHGALLISAPEYNSSISGVLKNAIDWVSRPAPGEAPLACFDGKIAALLSASPGGWGGLRGLDVPEPATAAGLLAAIGAQHPQLAHCAFILETPYDDPRADTRNLQTLRSFVTEEAGRQRAA